MDKALRYLALAAKAGALKTGLDDCAKAIRAGKGYLFILALDAGGNTVRQAEQMTAGRDGLLYRTVYTKQEIARATGRGSAVAAALVCDRNLAEAFAVSAPKEREQEERV